MYDQIGVHREGGASFSHDGYPSTTSTNFGSAADRRQHEVPRAFLRSAAHEVGHAFNQVHQESEGGADNSVMTTTPSVANVLAGPASGAPGVFPNNIDLSFNAHVRHHLVHLPDPAVRPGAMNWATSHTTTVPESDLDAFLVDSSEVELRISTSEQRVKLGQPLRVTWQVINQSNRPLGLPTDLSLEAGHARIYVLDPSGKEKDVGPFAVHGEETHLADLASGGQLKAEANLFWSSASGFIFDTPGPHRIDLRLVWFSEAGPRALKSSAEVFVDYPTSAEDNEVASLLMDPEVGMAVALGGGASHLKRGKSRMEKAISAHPSHAACKCMEPYARTASGRKAKGKPAGG